MALADIRQFLYYIKYLWGPTDFQNMQLWLQSEFRGLAEGAFGGAILSGLAVTPGGAMTVDVSAGLASAPDGRLINVTAVVGQAVASPVGNPARTLVVARPKITDANNIPEPANPANTVPLHQKFEYDVLVLNGTPAVTPAYPATQANDVILMGILLTAGHVTIVAANFERYVVSTPRKRTHPIKLVTASGNNTVNTTDMHLDSDATLGAQTHLVPSAISCPGQDFTFVKIDASANPVAVSGADLISGQNSWELADQWGTITIRSVGTGYRVV